MGTSNGRKRKERNGGLTKDKGKEVVHKLLKEDDTEGHSRMSEDEDRPASTTIEPGTGMTPAKLEAVLPLPAILPPSPQPFTAPMPPPYEQPASEDSTASLVSPSASDTVQQSDMKRPRQAISNALSNLNLVLSESVQSNLAELVEQHSGNVYAYVSKSVCGIPLVSLLTRAGDALCLWSRRAPATFLQGQRSTEKRGTICFRKVHLCLRCRGRHCGPRPVPCGASASSNFLC
jgi:hypothetical protein